jgi:hypothetical protein
MDMKLLCTAFLLFFVQCGRDVSNHFEQKQIIGEWVLNEDQINYPSLKFNADSSAVFTSRADTLYRFKFMVKGDSLILRDINNHISVNRIKTLNETELTFCQLLEHDKEQAYKKN